MPSRILADDDDDQKLRRGWQNAREETARRATNGSTRLRTGVNTLLVSVVVPPALALVDDDAILGLVLQNDDAVNEPNHRRPTTDV